MVSTSGITKVICQSVTTCSIVGVLPFCEKLACILFEGMKCPGTFQKGFYKPSDSILMTFGIVLGYYGLEFNTSIHKFLC